MTPIVNTVGVVIAIVIALASALYHPAPLPGGTTNYDIVSASKLQIGSGCNDSFKTCTGDDIAGIEFGTCSLAVIPGQSFTVAASSTQAFDCAAPNVVATDKNISMMFATTTAAFGPGFTISQAAASTTAAYIRVSVYNGTGASALLPASLASSTPYLVLR